MSVLSMTRLSTESLKAWHCSRYQSAAGSRHQRCLGAGTHASPALYRCWHPRVTSAEHVDTFWQRYAREESAPVP